MKTLLIWTAFLGPVGSGVTFLGPLGLILGLSLSILIIGGLILTYEG